MSYYILPSIVYINDCHKYIEPIFSQKDIINNITINKTLHKYLTNLKGQIDACEVSWDKYKKYTNPYEFIHTIVPNARNSICTYKPLSRSFFKMVEMCHMLNILSELPPDKCNSFHLAEGPGGFIEALLCLRNNPNDFYHGMTLIEDINPNVPGWRKSRAFLEQHKNVVIEKGIDGNGDIMNPKNLIFCYKKYKNQFDLITGDGGFDFSVHYLSQEIVSAKLILCQISFAIATQKIGGTFIIKMFDTFTKISLDILYLLSNVYSTVYFVKPCTSRYANSEKYIICKYFKLDEKSRQDVINALYKIIVKIQDNTTLEIESLFSFDLPYYFVNKIEEYNAIFGQQQVENIGNTLNLIDNCKFDKLELIKKSNILKCINWCKQYNMEYTSTLLPNNIFLTNRSTSLSTSYRSSSKCL
jgi:23S rRNA U2552 (ribose-2'-O)-methylase RlmE/FtsJ